MKKWYRSRSTGVSRQLRIEEVPGARVAMLSEIANIEETQLHDPAKAFDAWARAFAEDTNETEPRAAVNMAAILSVSAIRHDVSIGMASGLPRYTLV